MRSRTIRLLARWGLVTSAAGPALLFQQTCSLDPDIALRAFLQVVAEVGIFALDNLTMGLR